MKGFSLIEVIVVIAIIGVVGSVSVTTYNTLRQKGDSKHAAYVYVDALKEARNKAKAMSFDTDWGVNILSSEVAVFSGASYAGRVTARDRIYDLPDNLTVSGPTEIVFAKFSGQPSAFGTTTFSNSFGSSSVYLSNSGLAEY
jgi:prepilin-type N-terminal cleavage/methylation domain-containing protein